MKLTILTLCLSFLFVSMISGYNGWIEMNISYGIISICLLIIYCKELIIEEIKKQKNE